ncbi:MAG: delta-endotoxin CytB [Bacteroidota bacterium]
MGAPQIKRNLQARVIHLLVDEPIPKLEEIFAITDPRAAQAAFSMSNLFDQAISSDLRFNMQKAISLVKSQPDMAFYNEINQYFVRNDFEVALIVQQMTDFLKNVIGVTVNVALVNQIYAAVADVFVNLNIQKEDAWIFWAKESGHQTTYRYNLLFAVQTPETGQYVLGLPLGLTITIYREYERVLFITIKDEISFTVHMEGLKAGKLMSKVVLGLL